MKWSNSYTKMLEMGNSVNAKSNSRRTIEGGNKISRSLRCLKIFMRKGFRYK